MRVMVTIDHPWPGSFSHVILARVVDTLQSSGHEVDVLDLHHDAFDPVLRVEELAIYSRGKYLDPKVGAYQKRIEQSQHLVYIFPVWWEVMPAMLKGFFDKVFLPDWAFTEAEAAPLLTHITGATVLTTMAAPQAIYTSVEPVLCQGILGFCGVQRYRWFNLVNVSLLMPEQRAAFLDEIATYMRQLT